MSPRHWRVRAKLAAVLVVPAIAFLVLAGLNVTTSVRSAQQYGRGATVAEFGRQVTSLVHELQAERDLSAGYISEGRLKPDAKAKNAAFYLQEQLKNVDPAVAMFNSSRTAAERAVGGQAQAKIDLAASTLGDLDSLRKAVKSQKLTEAAALGQYTRMISALLDVDLEIGQRSGSRDLTQSVTALNDLSRAKEAASQVRGQLYAVGFLHSFQFNQFQKLSAALSDQQATLDRFRTDATDQERAVYDEQVNGQAVLTVKRIEDQAVNRQQAPNLNIDPQQWYAASTTRIELIRAVESSLLDSVIAQARTLRSDAQRAAISTGLIIAAILVIALLTSLLIARSMVRPLRRLRDSARDVAENRLPAAIERLRTDSGQGDMPVEPIGIDTRDEIGEVAKTFDAIHLRAIELATQQAALRSNVNSMFVNLSRRTQSLVERQLKLIDELETGEQDPDQLSNLFKLDHLATRMRRNSENLLVLAGEDAGRRWGRPIPLVDVLRAATSEVEQYHRIQLTGVPDVEVMGHAVNHVVHLIAELLENATVFSSPESKVLVHSQRLSDGGAMVEIEDRGIGMTAQEIADANERLAHPPVFDVSISRMMGLFVVGRLAGRHGITVRLRQSELGGVSAFVRLTSEVLASRFDPRVGEPAGDAGRPIVRSGAPTLPPPGQSAPRAGIAADLPRRQLPAGPSTGGGGPRPDRGLPGEPMREVGAGPGFGGPPPRTPPGAPPLPRRTPAAASGPANLPAGFRDGAAPTGDGMSGQPGMQGRGMPAGGRPPVVPPVPAGRDGGAAVPINALTSPVHQASTRGGDEEIRLPIFEQLQSEWFRRRTSSARAAAEHQAPPPAARPPAGRPGPVVGPPRTPPPPGAGPARPGSAPLPPPMPGVPAGAGPVPGVGRPGPMPAAAQLPEEESWQSPADEGWRAAERLLSPTTGGVTRAGLPMRVPQAHLVPGAAESAAPAPPPTQATSRSPEAVRSRLASYHQGVRRGRHSDRRGENADPSDVLVQTQEQP